MGYHRAGFDVVGVDINPQPNYPFEFVQADALDWLHDVLLCQRTGLKDERGFPIAEIDAIHASPPCPLYSRTHKLWSNDHPDLIAPLRDLLEATGLPYVIENVEGAPLRSPVVLEGQLFPGLRTSRPRLFETNWPLEQPEIPPRPPHTKMGRPPEADKFMHVVGNFSDVRAGREAMGIDWMTRNELSDAIPPAYTEYIGRQLLAHLNDQ